MPYGELTLGNDGSMSGLSYSLMFTYDDGVNTPFIVGFDRIEAGQTQGYPATGLPDQIVQSLIDLILTDSRFTFYGASKQFGGSQQITPTPPPEPPPVEPPPAG